MPLIVTVPVDTREGPSALFFKKKTLELSMTDLK